MNRIRNCFENFFALIIVFLFLGGCASSSTGPSSYESEVETETKEDQTEINKRAQYDGPKARIIVSEVECSAAKCKKRHEEGFQTGLRSELTRSNRFVVMVRDEELAAIKEEIEFSESEYVDRNKIKKGGMEAADLLVRANIIAYKPDAQTKTNTAFGIPENIPIIGGWKINERFAYLTMELELIDIRQARIVNATRVEATSRNYDVQGLGVGASLQQIMGPYFSEERNTPMEKAVLVMMDKAVNSISEMVPGDYYRYEPK